MTTLEAVKINIDSQRPEQLSREVLEKDGKGRDKKELRKIKISGQKMLPGNEYQIGDKVSLFAVLNDNPIWNKSVKFEIPANGEVFRNWNHKLSDKIQRKLNSQTAVVAKWELEIYEAVKVEYKSEEISDGVYRKYRAEDKIQFPDRESALNYLLGG